MTNYQDAQFKPYAGQLVAGGIGDNLPTANLEQSIITANTTKIHGLTQKIGDVFFRPTRQFVNPLERLVKRVDLRYGAGIEQAEFGGFGKNSKLDGTCMPWGDADATSQINVANFAYDIDISIKDYEIDKAVLTEEQVGQYTANKLAIPSATLGYMKYRAMVQLLSDVVSGTRSITSKTASDDTGTAVTYSPTVTPYVKAGALIAQDVVIPEVARKSLVTIPQPSDALDILQTLQGYAADMSTPSDDFNYLEMKNNFVSGHKPVLIGETKVLNALDNVMANANASASAPVYGYSGFPSTNFRTEVSKFADIVEIDQFASLPINTAYAKNRLGFVMMDPENAIVDAVHYANVESFRCTKERATGYSFQGEEAISVYGGTPACAMLFKTSAS